jgi:hypothetical protein
MKYGTYWFHLQKINFIANFHVLGLKNEFRAKNFFRLSRDVDGIAGIASGFWTKFEAQLAQLKFWLQASFEPTYSEF